jgi:hypothetical protein
VKVRFTGCSEEQKKWGDHSETDGVLDVGQEYEVEWVEEHSWHTKYFLKGIKGHFNSVCFETVKE